MTKGQRHIKIRELIGTSEVETQDELVETLKGRRLQGYAGYSVARY